MFGDTADVAWGYEKGLTAALDALVRPGLSGREWLSTVVPFVSGLFVRTPNHRKSDAEARVAQMRALPGWTGSVRDQINHSRLIDFQRLLAPTMVSHWTVVHFPQQCEIATSDTAVTFASTQDGEGYVVPIDRHTAVVISMCRQRPILTWADGQWIANIDHRVLDVGDAVELNKAIGSHATAAVFGATSDVVHLAATELGTAVVVKPVLLGDLASVDLGCHMYDYFRALSAITVGPDCAQAAADTVDWSTIDEDRWTGPIAVEVLFPDRTAGGVRVEGDSLVVDLTYGRLVRERRRAAGDFREGAMALASLALVRNNQGKIAAGPSVVVAREMTRFISQQEQS